MGGTRLPAGKKSRPTGGNYPDTGGKAPLSDRPSDPRRSLATHPWKETHEVPTPAILGTPWPKGVPKKVELDVWMATFSIVVLAVRDPCLLRMKLQTTFLQASPNCFQHVLRLALAGRMDDRIVCIARELDRRKVPPKPLIERVVHKEIRK